MYKVDMIYTELPKLSPLFLLYFLLDRVYLIAIAASKSQLSAVH